MNIPFREKRWQAHDRVIVGGRNKYSGKHGTVIMYATNREYLVQLDGETGMVSIAGGLLDPEKK